ncbi:DUF2510 domain-containing protein [Agromyces cerinus]|uniref:DUF2510 domain-containing protein n=1 Tax=Agromyces cerinus subsp. cerinus TaxID=232089 RepID=A0A1N6F270_9MICO|nr:DUF2510 domain-containing protein [Agromyces cerinus]SIN89341.1 protein of unknown function [Agromyces cerinus subsp. cerinus]
MTNPTNAPAGWYDDGNGGQRYWDGQQWTNHTAPASAQTSTLTSPAVATAEKPAIATESTGKKPLNVLGLVALIVAGIGFIFAMVPGAFIIGWIALPIGFILSIVALFLKGSKGLAIAALIVAVVGTIVGFVVFFTTAANSFSDAFGGTDSTVTQPSDDGAETAPDAEAEPGAEAGSRENPVPLGSVISGDEWDVVVNSITLNATDTVAAANEFNDAPADGNVYAVANVTVTYTGPDSSYAAMVGLDYVTAGGEVISTWDSFVIGPEPILDSGELYNGGSTTGNIVFEIPAAGDGVIRVSPGMLADEVFVAVK